MRIALMVLFLASAGAFAQQTLNPWQGQPSQRDEYEARMRLEAQQRDREYQMDQQRREQAERTQQMQQQNPGYQGIPYSVGGSQRRY